MHRPHREIGFRSSPGSAEQKVRIVIAGLRGEDRVAELCRKERPRELAA